MTRKLLIAFCILLVVGIVLHVFVPEKGTDTITVPENSVSYASYKCADASPIKTNDIVTSYFSQCFCMVSDDSVSEPVWLDILNHRPYFIQNTPDAAYEACMTGCDDLCRESVSKYLSENPDFKIQKRW